MSTMTFKTFTWPQNPDYYRHEYVKEPIFTENASGEKAFSGLGARKLTITGSGVFIGKTAYSNFRSLAKLFKENTVGSLVHPVWGTYNCYLTELKLTQEPRGQYVAYEFRFQEADSDGNIPY